MRSRILSELFFFLVLALCLLDDLLRLIGGNILIAGELAAEGTARLCHGAQVGCILEHLGKRRP